MNEKYKSENQRSARKESHGEYPLLHYNFMSHVCHVRKTNFWLSLLPRSLVQGYHDMGFFHSPCVA
jgi:hypothetical protein